MTYTRVAALGIVAAVLLAAASAHGVEISIDTFQDAVNTAQVNVDPSATCPAIPMVPQSVSKSDSGLSGVLGGCRTVTTTATRLDSCIDFVDVTPSFAGMFLDFSSSSGGQGSVKLVYDGCGTLNTSAFAQTDGFQIEVVAADAATVPYQVDLTLTDSTMATRTASHTITTPGPGEITFTTDEFLGVHFNSLTSIVLMITGNVAADYEFRVFRTFTPEGVPGTCNDGIDNDHNGLVDCADPACQQTATCLGRTAPLLSPSMMAGLVVMLAAVGASGLWRMASRRRS